VRLSVLQLLTVDPTASSVIVYGQRQDGNGEPSASLRLCVGRRRVVAPPSEKKIRPGEPLPRGQFCPSDCQLTISTTALPQSTKTATTAHSAPEPVPRSERVVNLCPSAVCRPAVRDAVPPNNSYPGREAVTRRDGRRTTATAEIWACSSSPRERGRGHIRAAIGVACAHAADGREEAEQAAPAAPRQQGGKFLNKLQN